MGEVYRAEDSRLDREVAIKVLPADFTEDPERLARFEREAKVLASLNHPHIAAIYEVGEVGGTHFLAMELAEGEDLARRLARGALPIEDAIAIALQIAEGLEAAHERGIVHRDLKPGNVVVDPQTESVKLLDFGLAKAWEESPSTDLDLTRSPTLTAQMTQVGVILGTAAYMSPEQARGKTVDKRADIWAFGCILFEMLAGQKPYSGRDVPEILASVIQGEPDWERLPAAVPSSVRRLIERCLRKDPRSRLRDIGDARNELLEIQGRPSATEPTAESRSTGRWLRALPWVLAAVLGVSLGLALASSRSSQPPVSVRRFAIDLPWHSVPNWTDFVAAISPSGDQIAYNGRVGNRVDAYVRSFDSLDGYSVAPARETSSFAFSPDGEWLGIQNGARLSKVPVRGGQPVPLANLVGPRGVGQSTQSLDPFALSWGPRGDLLVATTVGIFRVASEGGEPEQVTRVDTAAGQSSHAHPHHLPDGRRALFSVIQSEGMPRIGVVDLDSGGVTLLPINGRLPSFSKSGHLVFLQQSTAMAVPFDLDSLAVVGDPVPVLENVHSGPFLAHDGTMLYIPVRGEENARLVWTDRTGRATPISDEPRDYSHLDLAADGRTALLNVGSDVYEMDLASGTRQLLASESLFPIFTSDDRRATTYSGLEQIIVQQSADGSGESTLLVHRETAILGGDDDRRPVGTIVPTSWNPRTGELAFFDDTSDIWILDPEGSIRPFLDSEANERTGRFSPDGKWLAYVSNETQDYEVYVVAYPGPGRKVAVSIDGGLSPIWSLDGTELFFRQGGKLVAARVSYEPELAFGPPVELFEGPYTLDLMGHQRWDVSPDGDRFLMVESGADFRIVIVENWFEELERLAPTRGR